jgi:hypothetical protein
MTTLKLISAGLIAATMLAVPAMAREKAADARRIHDNAYTAAADAPTAAKRGCDRAPDAGAFATAPYQKPPCEPTSRH